MPIQQRISQKQVQKQLLAPKMRQSLGMLAMNLADLRAALYAEMASNPVIEDIEQTLENATVSEEEKRGEIRDRLLEGDYPYDDSAPDPGYSRDEEAAERRARFFDSQTSEETLERHLAGQLEMSDIPPGDLPLAEILIGELDRNGWFSGSMPDIMMVTGETEEKIRSVLKAISALDPPGCGATSLEECLLAQMDKLDASPYRQEVREILERGHLADIASGNLAAVEKDLGVSEERLEDVLEALRTLDPRPARDFGREGKSQDYINPEVHAVFSNGRWIATVDGRSLPEIRISPKYLEMLSNPDTDPAAREYIAAKIDSANAFVEAVEKREQTITGIAQAIFDRQTGFFTEGLKGLKPLTMQEVADAAGVHPSTVSRTVNGKYASTPKGTVELRRFFVSGVKSGEGEVSRDTVLDALEAAIESEDPSNPLPDGKLAAVLNAKGFKVARRTVAKYREALNIPGAPERKKS